ncbi:MAG: Ppx/GppA family phosphatase [Coriobacteriia bacterium]|nr:Ppx/GppA family phosphatase [Coriobacteriia bacterium]
MRLAAIDIGSNSLRCTIVEVPVGGPRLTLDEERAYVRLGRGTATSSRLTEEAMAEALDALDRMVRIARSYEVDIIRAIATAAIRGAENGGEFTERVKERTGIDIEVISSEHEGRLALLSALGSLALEVDVAVVDIGGGSVEIVQADGRHIDSVTSVPLGAVVMSERFRAKDPMPEAMYEGLGRHVRGTLAEALAGTGRKPQTLVGSGGTVTTLAAIVAAGRSPGLTSVHGFEMTRAEVSQLRKQLAQSTAKQRIAIKGMSEGRVDIILPGVVVLDEVMRALGAQSIVTNARGMREGIVIETVERETGVLPSADPMRSVRDFARQCRTDVPHAEQVRRLALMLFDGLAEPLGIDRGLRPILEAAALLHDSGYHISHQHHHKHSYHLISHASLPGFGAEEVRLIASVARYHTGALPKAKHEAMIDLGEEDRENVARLSALLRLADGLDRSQGRRVESLVVDLNDEGLLLTVSGRGELDVELHGAKRKSDLFERVWERPVEVKEPEADRRGL